MASQRVKLGLAGVVLFVAAAGGYVAYINHRNAVDNAAPVATDNYKADPDDLVFLKNEHPMSLKDEKDLKGRTLWMSAGGQMDYYPYAGHKVDYAHTQGVLLGAEKIVVVDAVEQVAPKAAAFRIPQGDRQVLLVFTRGAGAKEFAVPVGYVQKGDYTFATDGIFFYEDPHKLYSHWGTAVWQAVDEHRATLGMNERQVQMALGQISDPHGEKIGDRVVIYDDQGHPKRVTFEGGNATKIEEMPSQ